MHLPMAAAFTAIADEHARQRKLHAHDIITDEHGWHKLRGLVAQAVAELEADPKSAACRNFLLSALVQVAAGSVTWFPAF